jgi:hypothetical protein
MGIMGTYDDTAGANADIALAAAARDGDRATYGGLREVASRALAGALVLAATVLFGVSTADGMAALHAYRATSTTTTTVATTTTTIVLH